MMLQNNPELQQQLYQQQLMQQEAEAEGEGSPQQEMTPNEEDEQNEGVNLLVDNGQNEGDPNQDQ